MTETMLFDTLREGLWIAVMISMPLLTVGLVVGLAVGLFQALTSVQENTLTFVPKVAAMMVVFWVSMSFMTIDHRQLFHRHHRADDRGELSHGCLGLCHAVAAKRACCTRWRCIANNIANSSTTGFRREGMVFSEYVKRAGDAPSLSMGFGNTRVVDQLQGGLTQTGGTFDLAIEGDGFFLIDTPQGQQLTRSGAFTPGPDGTLVTDDGYHVLDARRIGDFRAADARNVAVAQDGTMSADGVPLAQVGLWQPTDPLSLKHEAGTRFSSSGVEPAEGGAHHAGLSGGQQCRSPAGDRQHDRGAARL